MLYGVGNDDYETCTFFEGMIWLQQIRAGSALQIGFQCLLAGQFSNWKSWGLSLQKERFAHYNDVIMSEMASQITSVRLHCLLNCRPRRRSKNTLKLHVTGLCAGNSPVTGEFPAQKASNAENISIWWRHHGSFITWSIRSDNPQQPVLGFRVFSSLVIRRFELNFR